MPPASLSRHRWPSQEGRAFRARCAERRGDAAETVGRMKDLKRKALHGGLARFCGQVASFALRLTSVVVLARLLSPEEFGLAAMAIIVAGVYELFSASLCSATIQKDTVSDEQASTLFWINIAIGVVLGLCASRPRRSSSPSTTSHACSGRPAPSASDFSSARRRPTLGPSGKTIALRHPRRDRHRGASASIVVSIGIA